MERVRSVLSQIESLKKEVSILSATMNEYGFKAEPVGYPGYYLDRDLSDPQQLSKEDRFVLIYLNTHGGIIDKRNVRDDAVLLDGLKSLIEKGFIDFTGEDKYDLFFKMFR